MPARRFPSSWLVVIGASWGTAYRTTAHLDRVAKNECRYHQLHSNEGLAAEPSSPCLCQAALDNATKPITDVKGPSRHFFFL